MRGTKIRSLRLKGWGVHIINNGLSRASRSGSLRLSESPSFPIEPWNDHTLLGVPAFWFSVEILFGASLNSAVAVSSPEVAATCSAAPVALPSDGTSHCAMTMSLADRRCRPGRRRRH